MTVVLYMPDGNRRFAQREQISLDEAYYLGGKTLKLLSEFFIAEERADTLIYHAGSNYTHKRIDSSLNAIYKAGIKTFEDLLKENFFENNGIAFRVIDHSGKLPESIEELVKKLTDSTKNATHGKVIFLSGYSLEHDINQALSKNPKNYEEFRRGLTFPDIDLVIRPIEMRPSGGPVYAMSQAQMIILYKLNPEITREDLEEVWQEYNKLLEYRISRNPYHLK